jgi:transposase
MSHKIELRNQRRHQRGKEAVEAILVRQEPVHLVARIFRIPQRTIFDWLSLYRSGGWDGLKEGRRCGRPRKVSADDMKGICHAVTLGNPQQFKFDFCLWTLNTLRALIGRDLGIELSKSSVSRLLGHLGLSPQRPVYKSYRQDPRTVEA